MKKILYIEAGQNSGGSFVSLYELLQTIDRTKYTPLVAFFNKTDYYQHCIDLGIKTFLVRDFLLSTKEETSYPLLVKKFLHFLERLAHRFFPLFSGVITHLTHWHSISALNQIIKKENIDIVHLNNQIERDFPFIFLRPREKIISHQRSERGKIKNKTIARLVNTRVNTFIANSRFCLNYWFQQGIYKDKGRVIHNAAILPPPSPVTSTKVNDVIRLGTISRLTSYKNIPLLIDLLFHLRQQTQQNIELVIIGNGEQLSELKQKVSDLDLTRYVHFLGYRPPTETSALLREFDLFVLLAENEPFGRVVVEAMLGKVPIAAAKSGGIPEIICREDLGVLLDLDHPQIMAKQLIPLLKDSKQREWLAHNAFHFAIQYFSYQRLWNELEEVYDK